MENGKWTDKCVLCTDLGHTLLGTWGILASCIRVNIITTWRHGICETHSKSSMHAEIQVLQNSHDVVPRVHTQHVRQLRTQLYRVFKLTNKVSKDSKKSFADIERLHWVGLLRSKFVQMVGETKQKNISMPQIGLDYKISEKLSKEPCTSHNRKDNVLSKLFFFI